MSEVDSSIAPGGLWQQIVELVKKQFTTESDRSKMERYFPLFISHELKGDTLSIGVAEALQVEWFTTLFKVPIESALHALGHPSAKVVFDIAENAGASVVQKPQPSPAHLLKPSSSSTPALMGMPSTLPLTENYGNGRCEWSGTHVEQSSFHLWRHGAWQDALDAVDRTLRSQKQSSCLSLLHHIRNLLERIYQRTNQQRDAGVPRALPQG